MFVNARLTQLFVAGMLCGTIAPVGVAQEPAKDFYGDPLPKDSIARLGSVRFHNPKGLTAMAYAQDGKSILAVGSDSMRFWDADMGKELARFDAEKDTGFWMRSAKLSPDGKYIALNQHQAVELLDRHTGKLVRTIKTDNPAHQLLSSAFSPDGKLLVTGNMEWLDDNPIRVWEVETGKELPPFLGRGSSLHALTFSADGKRLFSAPPGGGYNRPNNQGPILPSICVWDVETRKKILEIAYQQTNVAFALTGDLLAYEEDGIHVVSVPSSKTVCRLPPKQASFAFAPDGKKLAALDQQRELCLWDVASGKEIRRFSGYLGHGCRLAGFSPDGKRLAVMDGGWSHDGSIRQWDVETGEEIRVTGGHEDVVSRVAFSPNGKRVASASWDGTLRIWDAATGKELHRLDGDRAAVYAVAFSRDGKTLASSGGDATRLWDVDRGQMLAKLAHPPGPKGELLQTGFGMRVDGGDLAFSADGKTLTVVNTNGSVVTWDWAMRKVLRKLAMHERQFPRAVLVPHTQSALTAENHGFVFDENISLEMVHLWNISTGKVTHSMPLRKARDQGSFIICEALAASADGRLLATSQIMETQGLRLILRDPVIRLWERVTGKEVLTIKETMGQAIAFSPDGMTLAADDGEQRGWAYQHATTISLWDTLTGARQAKLVGHAAPIHGIAFSPDGKTFATASADHTVLIWKTPPMRAGLNNAKADDKQLEDWWKALAGDDAALAHQAAERLLAHSADATRMIRDKLKPAVPIDAKKIPPLIAALDSPDFEIRHDANQQLEAMGDLAEPALRKALEKPSSLEAKRRLEALIEKALGTTPEYVKAHRALAVLERIGSASARQVVDTIAKGAPGTRLTAEAQTVLERMPAK
jgi:WD40 repeat protein